MDLRTLQDLQLKDKKVLLRVDYNVPLNEDGSIADDTRIRESLPSIEYILKQGGSLILLSHLGRPKGPDPKLSLAPCAERLSLLLNRPVIMAKECIGDAVSTAAHTLSPGNILLLENLRFHPAEEKPSLDPHFAEQLSSLGNLYVNDAFGTAHRAHTSTVAIPKLFPNRCAAGLLIQKELSFLGPILSQPKRPFFAIIGGAKISTKIGVLKTLLLKTDALFIGGGMAFPFFKAQGIPIGNSLCEEEALPTARSFLDTCQAQNKPLYLPSDILIADRFDNAAQTRTIPISQGIPAGWQGVDIGPQTLTTWKHALTQAATLFWNGPVGVFEMPAFAHGTEGLARTLATLNATTIVGGGDSVAAVNKLHLGSQFSHLSTGGGACLEYIEFGHLPGLDVLQRIN
jgi:phosphoglycerate kinase